MKKELNIISVDDDEINLILIEELGQEIGLNIRSFINPLEALSHAEHNVVDIVLVDYMMPEMNGIEFIKEIRDLYSEIPVVMITAVTSDEDLKLAALKAGATEFLNKPLNGSEFKARMENLINIRSFQIMMKDRAKFLKKKVELATADILSREIETLEVLGTAAEYKDPETAEHIERVAHYSKLMGEAMGMSSDDTHVLFYASPFHDIGKIGIPDSILLKPGKLDSKEWQIMKTHAKIGYDIMSNKKSKFLQAGSIIALNHHEKYDGSGYPRSLKGDEIPLIGRIVAVADVFDALNSIRPYKEEWNVEKSLDYIKNERGAHFDPEIVDAFFDNIDEVIGIYNSIKDQKE